MKKRRKGDVANQARQEASISLSGLMLYVQALLFSIVLLLFVAAGFYSQKSAVRQETGRMQRELNTGIAELEGRLDRDALQLAEVLQSVSKQEGQMIRSGGREYFEKMEIRKLLDNKVTLYEDLSGIFVCRPGDFYLKAALYQEGKSGVLFREYMMENAEALASSVSDRNWRLCDIDGETYCVLVFKWEKADIYVGTGIPCTKLFQDIGFLFAGMGNGFTVMDRNGAGWTQGEDGHNSAVEIMQESRATGLSIKGYFLVSALEILQRGTLLGILLMGFISLVSILVQKHILHRVLVRPVEDLAKSIQGLLLDGTGQHLEKLEGSDRIEEVSRLRYALNYLLQEVVSVRLELYEKKVREQDMKLKQLRGQLKPHFYLNAIMTINTMTYQNRNDDIRTYLSRLSDHMRYMMRIQSDMVSLKEELLHIQNYVDMQKIKFPSTAALMIHCPEDLEQVRIPHLILYTVVENAFKYAMDLENTMLILITCQTPDKDGGVCRILIEDNGPGFSEDVITLYSGDDILEDADGRHIGLSNVKRSLYLQYGHGALLRLKNVFPHGACVEIEIPKERQKDGTEDTDCR